MFQLKRQVALAHGAFAVSEALRAGECVILASRHLGETHAKFTLNYTSTRCGVNCVTLCLSKLKLNTKFLKKREK